MEGISPPFSVSFRGTGDPPTVEVAGDAGAGLFLIDNNEAASAEASGSTFDDRSGSMARKMRRKDVFFITHILLL